MCYSHVSKLGTLALVSYLTSKLMKIKSNHVIKRCTHEQGNTSLAFKVLQLKALVPLN